jgi:hypothetical protein
MGIIKDGTSLFRDWENQYNTLKKLYGSTGMQNQPQQYTTGQYNNISNDLTYQQLGNSLVEFDKMHATSTATHIPSGSWTLPSGSWVQTHPPTVVPYVDYEDREKPTEMNMFSWLADPQTQPFLLLVGGAEARYPSDDIINPIHTAKWRILMRCTTASKEIASGESTLSIPMMIVDALNAKTTRGDILSIKVAKAL